MPQRLRAMSGSDGAVSMEDNYRKNEEIEIPLSGTLYGLARTDPCLVPTLVPYLTFITLERSDRLACLPIG